MYVITIDEAKCTQCGECVKICPSEVYKLENGRVVVGSADDCSNCQSCQSVCQPGAITVTEM